MDYFTTEIQSSTGISDVFFFLNWSSKSDEDFYWDMVVGLTASQYLVQEDGKGGRLMPGQIVRYPKVYKDYHEFHKIWNLCRMPIMTFPKGSHTTSSDSQSLRHSSKIITSCPALLTLSWCMSWSRCPGTWPWTFRQLKSSRDMPGLHLRPQWRSLPSGSRI